MRTSFTGFLVQLDMTVMTNGHQILCIKAHLFHFGQIIPIIVKDVDVMDLNRKLVFAAFTYRMFFKVFVSDQGSSFRLYKSFVIRILRILFHFQIILVFTQKRASFLDFLHIFVRPGKAKFTSRIKKLGGEVSEESESQKKDTRRFRKTPAVESFSS